MSLITENYEFFEQPKHPDSASHEEVMEQLRRRSSKVMPYHLVGVIDDLQRQIDELKREVEALKKAQG